jgi:TATA-box binding protein (TBP) (component of TFIID and TFIIIB)
MIRDKTTKESEKTKEKSFSINTKRKRTDEENVLHTRATEICKSLAANDGERLIRALCTFVQNRVIHIRLEIPGFTDAKFDVKTTTKQLKHVGAKYNSSRFRAKRRKFVNPGGGMHTFDEGNTIVTGTKNLLITEYIVNQYVTSLRSRKESFSATRWIRVVPGSWTQVNVVSNMSMPYAVDLQGVHRSSQDIAGLDSKYTPSKFTGLIMKVNVDPGEVTALIFDTGSLVVTGGKNMHNTYAAALRFMPVLIPFWESSNPSDTRKKNE